MDVSTYWTVRPRSAFGRPLSRFKVAGVQEDEMDAPVD